MTDNTPGTALAFPTSSNTQEWDDETKALMASAGLIHRDNDGTETPAPRSVVAAFLYQCARTQLDPHARQIYLIARKNKGQLVWTTQVSIDGFRLIAERSGHYAGQGDVEWLTPEGKWVDVWLPRYGDHPAAARATVYRDDFAAPMRAIALWDSYVQTTYKGDVTSMWRQHGPGQIAKCAEALALRKAFPMDLSALYTADEMQQADLSADGVPSVTSIRGQVEQDHDGPNVQKAMRGDPKSEQGGPKVDSGVASERKVSTSAKEHHTPPGAQRPGGSRPASKSAAGTTDADSEIRDKADVAHMWASRIEEVDDLTSLFKLHDEAAGRGVLDHAFVNGTTVEHRFLDKRAELQDADRQAQAGEPDEPLYVDEELI